MIKDIQVRYKNGSNKNKSVFGEPIKLTFQTGETGAQRWHMVLQLINDSVIFIPLDDIIGMGKTRIHKGCAKEYAPVTYEIALEIMTKRTNNGFSRRRLSMATGVTEAIIQKIECEEQDMTAKENIDTIIDFFKKIELKS